MIKFNSHKQKNGQISFIEEMCSILESEMREKNKRISFFEIDKNNKQNKFGFMISEYQRSAFKLNENIIIRSIPALNLTINHIIKYIIDSDNFNEKKFTHYNKCKSIDFGDIYSFCQDRFKAIRQELCIIKNKSNDSNQILVDFSSFLLNYIISTIYYLKNINFNFKLILDFGKNNQILFTFNV